MELGFNPHPPLSGFPPSFLAAAFIAEALSRLLRTRSTSLHDLSRSLLFLTCVAAPLTYISGYFGADFAQSTTEVQQRIATHQFSAKLLLISLIPSFVLALLEREATIHTALIRNLYTAFLSLSFALVLFTSYRGGELVFRFGAGVLPTP